MVSFFYAVGVRKSVDFNVVPVWKYCCGKLRCVAERWHILYTTFKRRKWVILIKYQLLWQSLNQKLPLELF